jgi:hypothetical protein
MESTITIDPFAVSILVGTVLPIVVGLVTKLGASSGLKAVLLLLLSAVQGLIVSSTMGDGAAVFSTETLLIAGLGWVSAVASYYGLLTPTGISPAVNNKTARFGLGSDL